MNIIEWTVWGIAVLILICQVALFSHRDPGVGRLSMRLAFLISIGLIVTLVTKCSKLHLLWWIPVAYNLNVFFFAAVVNREFAKFVEQMNKEEKYKKS